MFRTFRYYKIPVLILNGYKNILGEENEKYGAINETSTANAAKNG